MIEKFARVCLKRSSLRRTVLYGSVHKLEIILCSEFQDAIPGLLEETLLLADCICLDGGEAEELQLVYKGRKSGDVEVGVFNLLLPCKEGLFEITLRAQTKSEMHFIIPFVTLPLAFVSKSMATEMGDFDKQTPLLSCRRKFHLSGAFLTIEEEYGVTLGSHIYDSSLALLHSLPLILSLPELSTIETKDISDASIDVRQQRLGSVVELGSGCGLVGIYLSRYYSKVILTDKEYQVPLLHKNIQLNKKNSAEVLALPLEWSCKSHIDAVVGELQQGDSMLHLKGQEHEEEGLCERNSLFENLIIGADVLYDKQAATEFFSLIEKLARAQRNTTVIIAQKIRPGELVDVASMVPSFDCHLYCDIGSVRIFLLSLIT